MSDGDSNLTAAMLRAQSLAWQGRWDEVEQEIGGISDGFEQNTGAHLLLGMAYENTGRLEDALVEFGTILKLLPGQVFVLTKIARLKSRMGDVSGSVETYLEVVKIHESNGTPAAARTIWAEILSLEPSNIDARQRLVEAYLSEGSKGKAAVEYLQLSKWSARGGDYDQAIKYCEMALEIDRGNNDAGALLKGIQIWIDQLQSGEPAEDLRQEFNKFLESPTDALNPDSIFAGGTDTVPNFRRIAAGMDELLAAESIENFADRPSPMHFQDSVEIGHLLQTASLFEKQNQIEEAIVIYQQMVQNGIDRYEVIFGLGQAYRKAGRYRDSLRMLNMIADVNEIFAPNLVAIALDQRELGQLDKAREQLQAGIAIWMESGEWKENLDLFIEGVVALSTLHEKLGEVMQAAPLLTDAIKFLRTVGEPQKAEELEKYLTHVTLAVADPGGSSEEIPAELERVLSESVANSKEYLEQGLFLAAVDECLFGISCKPSYLPLHVILAEAYAAMGLVADAVSKYKVIVEVYLVRGNVTGAINMYQEILKLSPEDAVASSRLTYLVSEQEKALAE